MKEEEKKMTEEISDVVNQNMSKYNRAFADNCVGIIAGNFSQYIGFVHGVYTAGLIMNEGLNYTTLFSLAAGAGAYITGTILSKKSYIKLEDELKTK